VSTMTEIFSVFGVQTAEKREQLVITYPTGEVEVVNGPTVQWVAPGAKVEKRPAVVLKRKDQYCVIENSQNRAARIEKGPQVLYLDAFEYSGPVLRAIALKEDEYVRLRDNKTGKDRIEVGPSNGVFPPPHETVFDKAPQKPIKLAAGETKEILELLSNTVRVARGPAVVFLSTRESLVDQSLLVQAEEAAFAEALKLSKEAAEEAASNSAHTDAKENTPANRQASAAASSAKTSPRTAVNSFLSHLLGRKIAPAGKERAESATARWGTPKKELEAPADQLQRLGRTVRFKPREGGLTFAQAHEALLLDVETRLKLQPKYVGGKGDCLFCCFLHYDGKEVNKASIKAMRSEIADAIRQVVLEDPYMGVIFASNAGSDRRNGEGVTVEQYIAGIRNRAWGDTVCITQFCRLRRIKAQLHTIMNDERVEETDFSEPGARAREVLQIIHHPDPEDGDMYHYEVLVPKVPGLEQSGLTLREWRREMEEVRPQRRGKAKGGARA